jgi:hypothetical protein
MLGGVRALLGRHHVVAGPVRLWFVGADEQAVLPPLRYTRGAG